MKTLVVLAVSIVLVGILFCHLVMAAPSMPNDLQIVQPDPSLPKELSAFLGKWEGTGAYQYFLIVEKIDQEKASIYIWQTVIEIGYCWTRYEAQVIKESGKYKLWYSGRPGNVQLTLKGESLNYSEPRNSAKLKRVE